MRSQSHSSNPASPIRKDNPETPLSPVYLLPLDEYLENERVRKQLQQELEKALQSNIELSRLLREIHAEHDRQLQLRCHAEALAKVAVEERDIANTRADSLFAENVALEEKLRRLKPHHHVLANNSVKAIILPLQGRLAQRESTTFTR